MAAAFPEENISDDLIKCVFCNRILKNPKLLPCQHSCCIECLKKKVTSPSCTLSCPSCDRSVVIYRGDVQELPDNYLFEIIQKRGAALSNEICLPCEVEKKETKAIFKCLDCPDTFCSGCKKFHQYSTLSQNHRVVEIKDIQAGKYTEEIKLQKMKVCPHHSDDNMQLQNYGYCEECETLVCNSCVISEQHKFHPVTILDRYLINAKSAFKKNKTKPLEEKMAREAKFLDQLDDTTQNLIGEKETAEKVVNDAAAELHDLVEKAKENKLSKITDHFELELQKVQKAKCEHQQMSKQTRVTKSFADAFHDYGFAEDLFSRSWDVAGRINDIVYNRRDYNITTYHLTIEKKPCIEAYDLIEDRLGKVCIAEKKTDENGKVEYMYTLNETLQPKMLCSIETEMGSVWGVSITDRNDVVAVGGAKAGVYGSDGTLKKYIPLSNKVKNAYDVTTKGERVYISKLEMAGSDVEVFDMEGNAIFSETLPWSYYGVGEQFLEIAGRPISVAVDDNNDLFVATFSLSKVYKFPSEGKTVVEFLSKDCNPGLDGPESLCLTPKQELIVSNADANNIQAYDKSMEFGQLLWQYDGRNIELGEITLNYPTGICCDHEGNIYVCDQSNDRIMVLNNGLFVGLIRHTSLAAPKAICVNSNQELFIATNGAMSSKLIKMKVWK